MFNFDVILAGQHMVTDADRTTTFRPKITPHDHKQKYKKGRTFRRQGVLTGKELEDLRQKKEQKQFLEPSKAFYELHRP